MASIEALKTRAHMLQQARAFFAQRAVLEVDCPIISQRAAIDAHIDLVQASVMGATAYLHSSPEYGMKRLLSQGIGDIYQISHVFRDGEMGHKHNPEFTLVEWYRLHLSFEELIAETLAFISLFLGQLPVSYLTYSEAFERYCGFAWETASLSFLKEYIAGRGLITHATTKEDLIDVIFSTYIEPHLGSDELTVLSLFPAFQASLAKTRTEKGDLVAERFEIFYRSLELCNGYHELIDPSEQEKRLLAANNQRQTLAKPTYPLDTHFLAALKKGMPSATGVAVGFDRLMMLKMQASHIDEVIPFAWQDA